VHTRWTERSSHRVVDESGSADESDHEEADRTRDHDDDGDEAGDGPGELEVRLELGEGAAAVGLRSVALHDALEGEPADRAGEVEDRGEHHA